MLTVHVEYVGDTAVIACDGRIVRSEAAFRLRDTVMEQVNAHTIVLDLTEVYAVEGGGLGMLSILQKWAQDHHIQLKLFNPTYSVQNRLEHYDVIQFDIATFEEVMSLVANADPQLHKAA
jgi:anti-anti-sigma regulatory factor